MLLYITLKTYIQNLKMCEVDLKPKRQEYTKNKNK